LRLNAVRARLSAPLRGSSLLSVERDAKAAEYAALQTLREARRHGNESGGAFGVRGIPALCEAGPEPRPPNFPRTKPLKTTKNPLRARPAGFTLVEVMVATGIASLVLLTVYLLMFYSNQSFLGLIN